MFVANVTYYFEIFSWNLKKMRGEIYLDTDYINILTSLKIEISMFGVSMSKGFYVLFIVYSCKSVPLLSGTDFPVADNFDGFDR